MPSITFNKSSYFIDGQPGHLYSGEFHYFRVPRADWRKRMRLFREAGGNCIATYIPWLIHETVAWMRRFQGDGECLMLGLQRKITVSNPNVWPSLMTSGKKSVLFLMNLNSSPMECEVRCHPEWADEWIDLGPQTLGPMEVRVIDI